MAWARRLGVVVVVVATATVGLSAPQAARAAGAGLPAARQALASAPCLLTQVSASQLEAWLKCETSNNLPCADAATCGGSVQQEAQQVAALNAPPGFAVSDEYAKAFVATQHAAAELLQHMTTRITSYVTPPSSGFAEVGSSNWAGYWQNQPSTRIEQVQGRFTVTSEPSGADEMASWVGIGGVNGQNLIQTGVDHNSHQSWYELYPQSPVFLYSVNDGDYMYGFISYDHATGRWFVEIEDETTNTYWANEFTFQPDETSAEWIVEDAAGSQPVPNQCCYYFWLSEYADGSDNTNPPQAMNSPGSTLSRVVLNYPAGGHLYPSAVGSDGESFDVTQG